MSRSGRSLWCVGAGVVACLATVAGCSDGPTPGAARSATSAAVVETIDHEPCDTSKGGGHKVESFDAHGDGKPTVIKVSTEAGKELCRVTDINHDGKPDLWEYFDGNGAIRRREADYDANGIIDSVEFFEDGKLVKREYDTTGQHRVDTWDYFDKATGKRTKRERDTTNDGRVDQWWTWDGDKITIAIDRNGDGQPDPGATLIMDEKTGEAREAKEVKDTKPAPSASASTGPADGPPPPTSPTATASTGPAAGPPPPTSPTASAPTPPPAPTASATPPKAAGGKK
jgi:hypothetical protein